MGHDKVPSHFGNLAICYKIITAIASGSTMVQPPQTHDDVRRSDTRRAVAKLAIGVVAKLTIGVQAKLAIRAGGYLLL
jgi:hypothetical protein